LSNFWEDWLAYTWINHLGRFFKLKVWGGGRLIRVAIWPFLKLFDRNKMVWPFGVFWILTKIVYFRHVLNKSEHISSILYNSKKFGLLNFFGPGNPAAYTREYTARYIDSWTEKNFLILDQDLCKYEWIRTWIEVLLIFFNCAFAFFWIHKNRALYLKAWARCVKRVGPSLGSK